MPNYDKALFYAMEMPEQMTWKKMAQTLPVLAKVIKELTVIQTNSVEEAKRACVAFANQIDLLIILGIY
ncbi:hypothetical protein J2Z83_000732 [Virgibacillus natechei]|uniref:Uncharacterized protein n=1 Tax=Virgibacillus natechei TaxID=1216297 RepID=A0ABS4ICM1_9BACI|nr:hypothetical protein [Virgibacillus natechei]MBP1968640.1 hypothetical protein [Virgibacillus natechei]UZD13745.1 hypothetical protein OLD84_04110 [Virgibacillus natechei]